MSDKKIPSMEEIVAEKNPAIRDKKYNAYVSGITPKHNPWKNICKAYLVGGLICVLGQGLISLYMGMGLDKETAGTWNTLTLILFSVVLTGLNIYPKLAQWAGAGTVVPITGFANSVAAPAVEYTQEGQVFGVGCKIFTISGPVILYGIFSSWVLGVLYWVMNMWK